MHKSVIWDRTPPHLHIKCSPHVCGRVQGSQIFKRNSIISIRSKVMAVLVISWSLLSPHHPHHPCHPRHPHVVPIAPRRSPWSVISMVSVVSTCCPRGPHVVPVVPMSSPSSSLHLEGFHIIPNSSDTHPTQPPTPVGGGGPKPVKMQ